MNEEVGSSEEVRENLPKNRGICSIRENEESGDTRDSAIRNKTSAGATKRLQEKAARRGETGGSILRGKGV